MYGLVTVPTLPTVLHTDDVGDEQIGSFAPEKVNCYGFVFRLAGARLRSTSIYCVLISNREHVGFMVTDFMYEKN